MFIAATNFTLHYYFISKKRFDYFKDEEFKTDKLAESSNNRPITEKQNIKICINI